MASCQLVTVFMAPVWAKERTNVTIVVSRELNVWVVWGHLHLYFIAAGMPKGRPTARWPAFMTGFAGVAL
jgi:hypothetical protein